MKDTTKTDESLERIKRSGEQKADANTDGQNDLFPSIGVSAGVLTVGVYFGIVLTKSEVVRWQRVHDMFLFREAHMYLIIGTGILVAMVSMLMLKRVHARSVHGKRIEYEPKPFHSGVVIGGVIFGAGWAITGACPGPIYAQIGGGAYPAWITLAGAMIGMFAYAFLKPKLPH